MAPTTSDEPNWIIVYVDACLYLHIQLHSPCWYICIYIYMPWEMCHCVCIAHLLCDCKANDGVSLGDVPCHHSRVCFHRFDGHIDRRRQAICRHTERETKSLFYLLQNEPNEKISSFVFLPECRYCHQNGRKPSSAGGINGSAESIMQGGSSRVQRHKTIPQRYSGSAQGLARSWSIRAVCEVKSVSPSMKFNL